MHVDRTRQHPCSCGHPHPHTELWGRGGTRGAVTAPEAHRHGVAGMAWDPGLYLHHLQRLPPSPCFAWGVLCGLVPLLSLAFRDEICTCEQKSKRGSPAEHAMQRGVRRATRPVKLSAHAAPQAVFALSVPLHIPLRVPLVAVVPSSCSAPPPTLVPIPILIPAPPSAPLPLIPAPPLRIPAPVATPIAVPVPPLAHVPGPTPIPVAGPVPVALHIHSPAPIHVPPSIRRAVSAQGTLSAHIPIACSPLVPSSSPVLVPPAVLPLGPLASIVGF